MTVQKQRLREYNPVVAARDNYGVYCALLHPRYEIPPHVDIMIQALEAMERGELDRLMLNCPPRHSKSMTVTETFPAWWLGRHPDQKVIVAGNVKTLASGFGAKIRNKILSPEHQAIFPDCQITRDTQAKDCFTTTAGGEFFAVGIGGALPGRGAHLFCIDDPIRLQEEAQSKLQRAKIHDWYQAVAYNRLEPGGSIICVSTRWHENDLTGWLLDPECQEEIDNWQIVNFAAIAEQDEGWRAEGEALWESRWSLQKLQRIKKVMTQSSWAALYQQRPSAIEGIEIKRAWFRYYTWNPHMLTREDFQRMSAAPFTITLSIDTAYWDNPENDYSVIEAWLSTASGEYVLDVIRRKMLMPELYRCVKEQAAYWRPDAILIEKKASGISLVQNLQAFTKLPVIGWEPQGDKATRMRAVSYLWESGRIFHPVQASWLKDFEEELVAFPTSARDDQIDAASQYLTWRKSREFNEERLDIYNMELDTNASLFEDFQIEL